MRKFQCLLFVLKQSYICYYIICMTVPLAASWTRSLARLYTKTISYQNVFDIYINGSVYMNETLKCRIAASPPPICEVEKLDFWTQRNPGGTEIFQYQWGKKKRGKGELLKFSLWGKLLKMKFQTENKISEWI